MKTKYDVVILGAGHNGLVAAAYLARAGLSVLLLEKNDYIGGATTSQKVFPDYDAYLSRYSYLVSLFSERIIRDLGLKLELRRRAIRSFSPYVKDGGQNGLLLSNVSEETSRQSIFELTGSFAQAEQLKKFYGLARVFAGNIWDTMLEPLVAKNDFRRRFDADDSRREAWRSLIEEPLGSRNFSTTAACIVSGITGRALSLSRPIRSDTADCSLPRAVSHALQALSV